MFADIARNRRSCRTFTSEPLLPSEVSAIMEAGELAPSSRNLRPVRLVPVLDEGLIRTLAMCRDSGTRALETCTFAVIVAADPEVSDVWIEDCSIASIMMQLQAEELGIGSCWIQVRLRSNAGCSASDFVIREAGLEKDLQVLSIIAFGKASDD